MVCWQQAKMLYKYRGSLHTRMHTHTPPDEQNQSSGTAELRLWGGAGGRVWVEHPREKEMFRVERRLLYASQGAAVTHWSSRRLQLQVRRPPRPKTSLTPNRTLTWWSRPPSQPSLNPSLRLSRPLSLSPKLPLRPPPWRWMPQSTPRPNPQPNQLPKPMPRPRMGAKPRPRPPFVRTRQAPALRCRAA